MTTTGDGPRSYLHAGGHLRPDGIDLDLRSRDVARGDRLLVLVDEPGTPVPAVGTRLVVRASDDVTVASVVLAARDHALVVLLGPVTERDVVVRGGFAWNGFFGDPDQRVLVLG